MYLILASEDKCIMHISTTIDYESNGNFIIDTELRIVADIAECVEVAEVPENVEPYKYLYVDGEFVENPNYVENQSEMDLESFFNQYSMENEEPIDEEIIGDTIEETQEETVTEEETQ